MDEQRGASGGGLPPGVEDNGPWWGVFLVVLVVLFLSGVAAVVHSVVETF